MAGRLCPIDLTRPRSGIHLHNSNGQSNSPNETLWAPFTHIHTSQPRLDHSSTYAAPPPSRFHRASQAARRRTTGTSGWSPRTPWKREQGRILLKLTFWERRLHYFCLIFLIDSRMKLDHPALYSVFSFFAAVIIHISPLWDE